MAHLIKKSHLIIVIKRLFSVNYIHEVKKTLSANHFSAFEPFYLALPFKK